MAVRYGLLRLHAILIKEIIELKRDFIAYLFMVIMPIAQAIFFGFVMNSDPKHLPTLVIDNDGSAFSKSFIRGLENTEYYKVVGYASSEEEASNLLKTSYINFVVNIPANFSHDLVRGHEPKILIEADATDPVAIYGAYQAANKIAPTIFRKYFQGSLGYLEQKKSSFMLSIHSKYNPSILSQYKSLPGLLGVILSGVLVVLTGVSIAKEYELGTYETMLITPSKPIDIVLGKLIPHYILGLSVYFALVFTSYFVFNVPFNGSFILLTLITAIFIAATLGIGIICSVISHNQLEAATYANFYLLPALLLSGFVFPFYGMPLYAQYIGEIFPITHYLRICYGIMLKASDFYEVWPDIWPMIVFLIVVIGLSVLLYRKTLD